jgi:FkbM family methyltransferase
MFKMFKNFHVPADDIECTQAVFKTHHDTDLALEHCKAFDVCVQAGGNFGVWPKYLAKKFKTVYTFEPDPINFSCLCRNIGDLQNVIKIQAGLGDAPACIELERKPANAGAHYVNGLGVLPIIRLDDLNLPKLDFLCLDIEGFENNALIGAMETIKKFKPVIQCEDKGHSRRYGFEKGHIESMLAEYGYGVVARPNRDVILAFQG